MGDTIDPSGDPNVLYPIDQFHDNVLVTKGASFTFSDPAVGQGIDDPYTRVTFTSTGITFTNLVGDPFRTSRFAGFIFDLLSPDIAVVSAAFDSPSFIVSRVKRCASYARPFRWREKWAYALYRSTLLPAAVTTAR